MINFVDVMLSAILVSNSLIRGREREKRERYTMWQFSDFVVVVQASVLITGVNLCC